MDTSLHPHMARAPDAPLASPIDQGDEPIPARFDLDDLQVMAQRMQLGLITYPMVWALLMLQDGQFRGRTGFIASHGIVLTLISVIRHVAHRRLLTLGEGRVHLIRRSIVCMSMAHNLYWGVLCAIVFTTGVRDNQAWMMLVATVGITAGGMVITSSDPILPRYYGMATLGPTALALLPDGGRTTAGIEGMVILLVVYAAKLARIARREHVLRIQAQMQLERRAHEMEALSRTDALTRIANRLCFEEQLGTAWRLALRRREPLSVAMVDLDHFKRINDQHGHPFGDQCLVMAAQAIAREMRRPGDLVARYGGEEFVMLMPNTDIEGALVVANAVLRSVAATQVGEAGAAHVTLSCSIGVASVRPKATGQAQALVRDADKALYEAKARGRARVHAQDPRMLARVLEPSGP